MVVFGNPGFLLGGHHDKDHNMWVYEGAYPFSGLSFRKGIRII